MHLYVTANTNTPFSLLSHISHAVFASFKVLTGSSHNILTKLTWSITSLKCILISFLPHPTCASLSLSAATPLFAAVWNFPSAALQCSKWRSNRKTKRKEEGGRMKGERYLTQNNRKPEPMWYIPDRHSVQRYWTPSVKQRRRKFF